IWPIWCNVAAVQKLREAKDAFGMDGAEFIPYFDATPPAATDMNDVYISAYKKPDGKVLLAVVNTSNEARNGTVTIHTKRIGIGAANIVSWPDKKVLSYTNNSIPVNIPGRD